MSKIEKKVGLRCPGCTKMTMHGCHLWSKGTNGSKAEHLINYNNCTSFEPEIIAGCNNCYLKDINAEKRIGIEDIYCRHHGKYVESTKYCQHYMYLDYISTDDKTKKSGCFLTTAVCNYKGFLDDCYELNVLRSFRDDYLLATEDGVEIVNYYYDIAPALAACLIEKADLEQVWSAVADCVIAIESGRHKDAIVIYKAMVHMLQEKFSVLSTADNISTFD
jgi:hypothetical protein